MGGDWGRGQKRENINFFHLSVFYFSDDVLMSEFGNVDVIE